MRSGCNNIKKIKLFLKTNNEHDNNIYNGIMKFAQKHNYNDESEALKAFIMFLHFNATDMNTLSHKIKNEAS